MIRFLIIYFSLFAYFMTGELRAQYCNPFEIEETDFKSETRMVKVNAGWYPSWLEHREGQLKYPEPLPPLKKWNHPFMKDKLPSAMHEDSYASDISNMQGPIPENATVQYFQVREKGKEFSGMCPSFAFVDENTMVTLSFGRTNTTLLILDIENKIKVLDAIKIPGRGHTAMELASKKARMALFRNTSGGAYFFLSKENDVIIPGPEYSIFYIPIKNRRFERDRMLQYDILEEIEKGDLLVEGLKAKEGRNKLTAVMPDGEGNIWYTSKMGVIGVIDLKNFRRGDYQNKGLCPKTYSFYIGGFGLLRKIEHFFGKKYDKLEDLEFYKEGMSDVEYRRLFREFFMLDPDTREEIQNSFAVGPDGVYIVSNIALYKLRFNDQTKTIEMDPKWEETFRTLGDQIYPNDGTQKRGHLNDGSGTTPTLMDNRFVIIADNDQGQINLNIYSQEDGQLVNRLPLFEKDSSACENSVVAYRNSLFIGNTYNYVDPFDFNDTPGGIDRYDLNPESGKFEKVENWPVEHVDAKTATPKMSTKTGVIYVYNRHEESDDGHYDWQLTALDYETGRKVFYIRPEFGKGEFNDNIFFLMKSFSLGMKNYDKKVFNNIWATYTFGPNNSIYIGAYRGFLKFSSDTKP
ncbi:hypothetical protein [Lutimonas zeaxanthinifaciens]|uniref:hypothetical protein n=1 Tax=Lutimonas zeaxanthinifaciens TaxID=3060215 RepID=UPI00265CC39F|nr:hypothetical protein [Lutimonas sp. YSD2104]WKK65915.1 hypothetical protein QZH61_15165 [Lutimonas sp. YSD2104]